VALGGRFSGSGKPGQEGYDFVGAYGLDLPVAEHLLELGEDELIVLERIIFRVHPMVLPKRLDCLADFHTAPPGLVGYGKGALSMSKLGV
jgi:hypothetical protein